jgi:uroporphyrinogen decarboxylase
MRPMTPRQRFAATLAHQPVDRAPFDLAGTSLTTVEHADTVRRMRSLLGIPGEYDGRYQPFDEDVLQALDIDFRRVGNILFPKSSLARRISDTEQVDGWGVKRRFTGLYWDIVEPPLRGATVDDLERFPWPRAEDIDQAVIDGYAREAKRLYDETDAVVCGEHPVWGVLEIGCWMCGFDEFLFRMAADPDFVRRFFDIWLDYQKKVIARYYGALGRYIHFTMSGDDFGTQNAPFVSPEMFAEFVKPCYAERIRYTHEFTDAHYWHHTCGSVFSLVPHLIDAGVAILNPIQPGALDMEPARLRRAYGDRLTFHGGIDTQHVLPEGTVNDVKAHVRSVLDDMAHNGGYVLAPAHNIQRDVPAENILAIYEAGREYFAEKNPQH